MNKLLLHILEVIVPIIFGTLLTYYIKVIQALVIIKQLKNDNKEFKKKIEEFEKRIKTLEDIEKFKVKNVKNEYI